MTPAILTPLQLQAKVDALTVMVEYLMARASNGSGDPEAVHQMHLQEVLSKYPNLNPDTRQAIQAIFDDGGQWVA